MSYLRIEEKSIGMDETGVGDYFSPLVATAVYIPENKFSILKKIPIADSKKLSTEKILNISPLLKKEVISQSFSVSQTLYNELINKGFSSHDIKTYAHFSALDSLFQKLQSQKVNKFVLDQYAVKRLVINYLRKIERINNSTFKTGNKLFGPNFYVETKADENYASVAIASILARKLFLEKMEKQSKEWNTRFPFGVSEKVVQFGKNFYTEHGEKNLYKISKWHFKTTQKIISN